MPSDTPAVELIQTLIDLEQAGVPLDDFGNALLELSLVDQYTHIDLFDVLSRKEGSLFGLHGVSHTVRVVFWVLYLVEISNRLGYPVSEEEALTAMYAALVHDLSRRDDLPGGQHGRDAANKYRILLQDNLSAEMLGRCMTAVEWHGYAETPLIQDPIWMLLKDADALDRARLAPPGVMDGCDPTRLLLPVLHENTPVLDACLSMSMLLTVLLNLQDTRQTVFRNAADVFAETVQTEMLNQPVSIQQAACLITDRLFAA